MKICFICMKQIVSWAFEKGYKFKLNCFVQNGKQNKLFSGLFEIYFLFPVRQLFTLLNILHFPLCSFLCCEFCSRCLGVFLWVFLFSIWGFLYVFFFFIFFNSHTSQFMSQQTFFLATTVLF